MKIALATASDVPAWEVDDKPFVQSLQNYGVQVNCPVWNDPEVEWNDFDACLIRSTWDYTKDSSAFIDWAFRTSKKIPIFNPPDILRWNADKSYLRRLCEMGVPVAPTVWIDSPLDLKDVLISRGWKHAFLKPLVGACAEDTVRFTLENTAEAQAVLEKVLPRCGMMLQPYLQSVETEGEYSVLFFDGKYSHCVRKIPVPGDYRVQDDFGAKDEPAQAPESLVLLCEKTLSCLPEQLLYARVDALRGADGTWYLNELELIEPSLFFRHSLSASKALASALIQRVESLCQI